MIIEFFPPFLFPTGFKLQNWMPISTLFINVIAPLDSEWIKEIIENQKQEVIP